MDAETELVTSPPSPQGVDELSYRLITDPDDREKLTLRRTTDARTGVARALQEYLAGGSIVWEGGRRLEFKTSCYVWSEPETTDAYPSLAIVTNSPADYESDGLSPTLVKVTDGRVTRYLRQVAELKQVFSVQVWASDPEERMGLVALIEDSMEPTDWMSGLRLELPFYFGARATYEKLSVDYQDSPEDAQQGYRKAMFAVAANVPQYVIVGALPNMRIRRTVVVDE